MQNQRGITLVEVLVTMIILSIGLLGLVALQARVQVLQAESYQRVQALILVKDMASRLANNRLNAVDYVTGADDPIGVDVDDCADLDPDDTRQGADAAEWCAALKGAAETIGADKTEVGAMVGGRGCVENLGNGQFLVTVAWQGLAPIAAPPASVACGLDEYNGPNGSLCLNDRCRRVVTTIVRIAELT